MTLGPEVINLIRLHLLDDPDQVGAVGEVAVVKHQPRITFVGVLIEMIDPVGVEAARASFDPMHLIALLQQQLRQVTTVLPGDACDQGGFGRDVGMREDEELVEMSLRGFRLMPASGSNSPSSSREASLGEGDASAVQDNSFSL